MNLSNFQTLTRHNLTLSSLSCLAPIFTYLKLCLGHAIHNLKRVKSFSFVKWAEHCYSCAQRVVEINENF